jgi:mRNA interferase RelE/StbE
MKYQLVIPKGAQKELKRIDKKSKLKILSALVALSKDPYLGKKLEGKYKGKWSYRIWPYRIIYQVRQKELVILIICIVHRQGAYK